jgi:hypothetical protein
MAKIVRVDFRTKRRKKFEHFKLKLRVYLFRSSVLLNLACLLYFLDQQGSLDEIYIKLTYYYKMVSPILEAILTKLPHI